MCGIFGFVHKMDNYKLTDIDIKNNLKNLFLLSETRGKEAAGIALVSEDSIDIYKDSLPGHKMLKTKEYNNFLNKNFYKILKSKYFATIGHTRLVTNGFQAIDLNNQPVKREGIVVVHNGIITNEKEILAKFPSINKTSELDSELFPILFRQFFKKSKNIVDAVRKTFREIEGEASIAALFEDLNILLLATNVGSLYYILNKNTFLFVSEEYIARQTKEGKYKIKGISKSDSIFHINTGEIIIIKLDTLECQNFEMENENAILISSNLIKNRKIEDKYDKIVERRNNLKRCTKCILPETMPFIYFDENGVCNYCKNYKKIALKGKDNLLKELEKFRKKNKPDCLVAFSGGRDSSYALHYIKRELGMNPIAYTYDWGMVNSLARRNQARLTGKLGVEHIWVSADIKWKRRNIAKNVKAWLKRPQLGMIPIFIAGDKQFFYYANQLMKHTGIDLMIFSQNPFEKTEFKTGFANVPPEERKDSKYYRINLEKRIKLALYYGKEFLLNPRYLNSSIFDTIFAYFSYYFIKQDYLFLYDYILWDEEKINSILIDEYNWEIAKDTSTTWRIGDGTAAFYNYIFYTVAGFTENDTLRSNQIREGYISREDALEKVERENQPRWSSIREYLQLINLDFDEVIKVIDKIPKLY